MFLNKSISKDIINRKSVKRIQSFSLDAVITMPIGTIDLGVIKDNLILVLILLVTGSLWNISCFLLTYKVLIPKYPFERGIADYGQSMGTTSIGLILQTIADKDNIAMARRRLVLNSCCLNHLLGEA